MPCLALVYRRNGQYLVDASSQTTAGFWVAENQTEAVAETDLEGLEAAVRRALKHSRSGVSTPHPTSDLISSLLGAAQVKAWSTFIKQAKLVEVALQDEVIVVTPHRNRGATAGFEPLPNKQRLLTAETNHLGSALQAAFSDTV